MIRVPGSGSLTIGPFDLGAGASPTLAVGDLAGTFNIYNGTGGPVLVNQKYACDAPASPIPLHAP